MADFAIVHKATRVITGCTTDPAIEIGADYTLVALPAPLDLAGGPYKLRPNGTLATPTKQELDDGLPERRAEKMRLAINVALDVVIADQAVPDSLRTYFSLLKAAKS